MVDLTPGTADGDADGGVPRPSSVKPLSYLGLVVALVSTLVVAAGVASVPLSVVPRPGMGTVRVAFGAVVVAAAGASVLQFAPLVVGSFLAVDGGTEAAVVLALWLAILALACVVFGLLYVAATTALAATSDAYAGTVSVMLLICAFLVEWFPLPDDD